MEKETIISIQALLSGRNEEFDQADKRRVKLIRHKDNRTEKVIGDKTYKESLFDLYLNDNSIFLDYQSEQLKKNFEKIDYIVAFIGEEGATSRFLGVYKNNGVIAELGLYNGDALAKFDFQELSGFELLKERIVIEWKSPVMWHQYYDNEMPVVRIDRGLSENNIPVFKSFEDVLLDYNQQNEYLKLTMQNGNQNWKVATESI